MFRIIAIDASLVNSWGNGTIYGDSPDVFNSLIADKLAAEQFVEEFLAHQQELWADDRTLNPEMQIGQAYEFTLYFQNQFPGSIVPAPLRRYGTVGEIINGTHTEVSL